jgi:two-component system, OmpR family, response regulator VanR
VESEARPVLVVEDDQALARMIAAMFELDGYEVACAYDGLQALAWLERSGQTPSVIVTDVMMPNLDGIRLVGILRADRRWKSTPIVVLSAKSQPYDIEVGLRAGADDYVTKPFDPTDLVARAARLIGNASTRTARPLTRASGPGVSRR